MSLSNTVSMLTQRPDPLQVTFLLTPSSTGMKAKEFNYGKVADVIFSIDLLSVRVDWAQEAKDSSIEELTILS